ncbi:MAG TPA: hypothetical protein VGR47_03925 [Terracidiphilus sp.]|nr:hypothetical protein [Terracidiphilus sp.]
MAASRKVDSSMDRDEALERQKLVTAMVRESLIKKCYKGMLALCLVLGSVLLGYWFTSHWRGPFMWTGLVLCLIALSIGIANLHTFFESLARGEITSGFAFVMKSFVMQEWMKVFLAFLSIILGMTLIVTAWEGAVYYIPHWVLYGGGILFLSGGFTFFWTRSRFYRA